MGMDIRYKGKLYNPKAMSKGTRFGIQISRKDEATGEWHSKFLNVYTKENLVVESKQEIELKGFMVLDLPYQDRPAELTVFAQEVKLIGDAPANKTVDHTDKKASGDDYGF